MTLLVDPPLRWQKGGFDVLFQWPGIKDHWILLSPISSRDWISAARDTDSSHMTTAAPAHIAGLGVSRSAEKRVGRWPSEMPRRNEAQGRPRDVDEMHGPGMSDCQRPDERPRCNGLHTCSGVPRAVFIPHRHPTLDGATSPSFVGSIACTVSWQVLIGDPPPYNQPLSMAPAGGQRPDGSPMTMLSYAPGALASPHSVQFPGVENSEPSPVQDASWESTGVPAVLPWTGRLCNVDSKSR